jgi:growth hormone-inducible transmembrane protein
MEGWLSSEALFYTSKLACYGSMNCVDIDLHDSTQKILHHARMAEQGLVARDPMREAIGLELDMLNILYVLQLLCHSFIDR